MLERFGFTGDKLTARIGDLSGGERRRFQLLRLLLSEPNVLLLDEPTNDLDIDTLNVVEDFLDSWPGTLVVVSHDRYFLERVTDSVWALMGDGQISMLPRRRGRSTSRAARRDRSAAGRGPTARCLPAPAAEPPRVAQGGRVGRGARRRARRSPGSTSSSSGSPSREAELHERDGAAPASDHERLAELSAELTALAAEKEAAGVARVAPRPSERPQLSADHQPLEQRGELRRGRPRRGRRAGRARWRAATRRRRRRCACRSRSAATSTPRRSRGSGERSTSPRATSRSTRLVIVPLVTIVCRTQRTRA